MAPVGPAAAAAAQGRPVIAEQPSTIVPGQDPPTHVRIYSDGIPPTQRQGAFAWLIAATSLSFYVGFMNWFALLCVAACFSRVAAYAVLALLSTLLLPCQPVLWPAFNRMWLFKTW